MNHPKLTELTTEANFAARVAGVIAQLEARDEHPRIFETKRTVEQQREKVRKGYSKTMRSYHLKRGKDGGAKAADIADAAKGWNASQRFWCIIGAACQSYGLGWGGLFGLNRKQVQAVKGALDELRAAHWPHDHPAYQRCPVSWDPAHVQFDSNWPK